jgi:hypothetical protein
MSLIILSLSARCLYLSIVADELHLLRGVVSTICVGLAETINKVGPGFVEHRMLLFIDAFDAVSPFYFQTWNPYAVLLFKF